MSGSSSAPVPWVLFWRHPLFYLPGNSAPTRAAAGPVSWAQSGDEDDERRLSAGGMRGGVTRPR